MTLGKKSAAKKGINGNNSSILTNLGVVMQFYAHLLENSYHNNYWLPLTLYQDSRDFLILGKKNYANLRLITLFSF